MNSLGQAFNTQAIILTMDASSWPSVIIALLVIICIALTLRPKYPLQILLENGRVIRHEGLAKAQVGRVVEFLEKDVSPPGKITVMCGRDSRGVLRINFRGDIDWGTRQQIRNYLMTIL